MTYAEHEEREREKSLEAARKKHEDYERELFHQEEMARLEREKERRKREAAERAEKAVLEAKLKKMEIDVLHN